jgi:hypothetical protein
MMIWREKITLPELLFLALTAVGIMGIVLTLQFAYGIAG